MFASFALLRHGQLLGSPTHPQNEGGVCARGGLLLSDSSQEDSRAQTVWNEPTTINFGSCIFLMLPQRNLHFLDILFPRCHVVGALCWEKKSIPGTNYSGIKEMIIFPLNHSKFMLKDKYKKYIDVLK